MKKIVLTRTKQNNAELRNYLEKLGYEVFEENLFEYEIEDFDIKSSLEDAKYKTSIITSPFAATRISEIFKGEKLKIIVVGNHTAEILQNAGFEVIGIYEDLNNLLDKIGNSRSFVYFRGEEVTLELGFEKEYVIYKTKFKKEFSDDFLNLVSNNQIEAISIFSLKTAENFYELAAKHNIINKILDIKICCLSHKIQKFFSEKGFATSISAAKPNNDSLKKLFEKN